MKQFKDFKIKPAERKAFVGDKIKAEKLINKTIVVHDFKITDSHYEGKYLNMQIELNGFKYVVFTTAATLMEMLQQVPTNEFPFETTISNQNGFLEFT